MNAAGRAGGAFIVTLCLATAGACTRDAPSSQSAGSRVVASYSEQTGRLTELKYDRNNDGKVDTWATMDGARVLRVELDTNGDGKVDRWEYYQPGNSAAAPGLLQRVEEATRYDGRITRREFLDNGRLVRIEEDTDGDGLVDKWETYRDGALAVMELDTNHRGRADRRLVYGAGGTVDRIEVDSDGSGRFQIVQHGR